MNILTKLRPPFMTRISGAVETDPNVIQLVLACDWDSSFTLLLSLYEFSDDDEVIIQQIAQQSAPASKRRCLPAQMSSPTKNPQFKSPIKREPIALPPKLKLAQLEPMTNKPFKSPVKKHQPLLNSQDPPLDYPITSSLPLREILKAVMDPDVPISPPEEPLPPPPNPLFPMLTEPLLKVVPLLTLYTNMFPKQKRMLLLVSPTKTSPMKAPLRAFTTLPQKRGLSTRANAHIFLSTQKPTHGVAVDEEMEIEPIKVKKPMMLSAEQEFVLGEVLAGKSLFYTGLAGTGKSVLLREIIKELRARHGTGVAVTALTGLAACNIGGMTLHSFAGVGLAQEDVLTLLKRLRRNRKARDRWVKTKVIVIDEILMVHGEFFSKLNEMAKRVRKNQRPFGGIQVVLCGDFFQLPPVLKLRDDPGLFAFDSQGWKEVVNDTYTLTEVFRQLGDQQFIDILNELRMGQVLPESVEELKRLARPLPKVLGIVPAELHPKRNEVDRANSLRLALISADTQTYTCVDGGSLKPEDRAKVLAHMLAPPRLTLKKGAQVMCIKNIDETLVNGTLGTVIDFVDRETYLKQNDEGGDDESDYVDLTVLSSTPIIPEESSSPKIGEQMAIMAEEYDQAALGLGQVLPLVQFRMNDNQFRYHLMEPEKWLVEDEHGAVLALRLQVPLILAWLLLIHKSQGQTLPYVRVNLALCFETGQAYVALSRATSRAGLQVVGFNPDLVRCHPKVLEFYLNLKRAQQFGEGEAVKEKKQRVFSLGLGGGAMKTV